MTPPAPSTPPPDRAGRVYALLLSAYPRRVRDRLGADMRETFTYEHASARSRRWPARAWFWIVTVAQAVWFGLVERILRGGSMRSVTAIDLRAAWRSLAAAPFVTGAAVLSLALGIGANTALFSILNSLLFKTMPVHEPERLVRLERQQSDSISNPIWEELRRRERQLAEGLFAFSTESFDLSMDGTTESITGALVSGGVFRVLGLGTAIGQPFGDRHDVRRDASAASVAVITHAFWQRRFGGAPDVVGRTLVLERVPFTIIGVTGPSFAGLDIGTDLSVMVPLAADALMSGSERHLDSRSSWFLHAMARLRPGQSIDDATAALRAVQPQVRLATIPPRRTPADEARYLTETLTWVPAATGRSPMRGQYREPLVAALVVVGIVLLIACANIANLLLARATARRHEMSVRLALGASRARLARQLLAESAMLAAAGALLGLLIASWGGRLLVDQLSTWEEAYFLNLALDWRVLAFTAGVAIVTALLFGSAAAFSVARVAPHGALKEQARSVTGDGRGGLRSALVIVQVALSLALLVGAGLFVGTFTSLARAPLGFDLRPLLVTEIELAPDVSTTADRMALFERLRDTAAAVPGVAKVAPSYLAPVGDGGWNTSVDVPGGIDEPDREAQVWVNALAPGWFDTYGMQLRSGRDFNDRDRAGQPPVVIVNEAFARRRLGDGVPAVGRIVSSEIEGPSTRRSYQIVGVVNDAVYRTPRHGVEPTVYVPLAQLTDLYPSRLNLTIRTEADSAPLRRALADALGRVDARAAISFRSIADQLSATMTQERLMAMVAGVFGVLALVMVSVGLAGVTSYWVHRRRSEIGIRLALGARPSGVVRMVLGQIGWLLAVGVAVGLAISLWASGLVRAQLFNLGPRDPVTFVGAALVLVAVGLLAGWLPARRAARVDPVSVLRE
jgi:predicted permease